MTTTSMLPDVGIELREGYAEVGDQNLHYVEAGDGAPGRSAARLPGVLVRLAVADRTTRSGGFSGGRPRHAWLQPVIEARGLRVIRRRPARRRYPRSHWRAR